MSGDSISDEAEASGSIGLTEAYSVESPDEGQSVSKALQSNPGWVLAP